MDLHQLTRICYDVTRRLSETLSNKKFEEPLVLALTIPEIWLSVDCLPDETSIRTGCLNLASHPSLQLIKRFYKLPNASYVKCVVAAGNNICVRVHEFWPLKSDEPLITIDVAGQMKE